MSFYKVIFFFESEQQALFGAGSSLGWTETWYTTDQTGAADSLDSVGTSNDVIQYLLLRAGCLPVIYRISFIRVSKEGNPRAYKIFDVPNKFGNIAGLAALKGGAPAALAPAQVNCALLVDFMKLPGSTPGEPAHHKKFLMRGVPGQIINGNIIDNQVAEWSLVTKFLNFVGKKIAGGAVGAPSAAILGLRFEDPTQVYVPLTGMVIGGIGPPDKRLMSVTGVGLPALARGDHVTIKGSPDGRLNRNWTNLSGAAGGPYTLGTLRKPYPGDSFTFAGPGVPAMRPVKFSYGLCDQYTIIGMRNKKTGRVFRQLRGRSRSRI